MPGKINPVMTEVMILACHRVAGNQAGVGFRSLLRGTGPRRLLRRADPQHPQQYRHPEPQHGALRGQVCEGPFRQCRKCPYGRTLDLAGDDGKCALRLQDRQPCGQSGVRTQYYLP
ncbi:MAG: hypothetical protein ACLRWP_09300 [Bilophila wadsworthia]